MVCSNNCQHGYAMSALVVAIASLYSLGCYSLASIHGRLAAIGTSTTASYLGVIEGCSAEGLPIVESMSELNLVSRPS